MQELFEQSESLIRQTSLVFKRFLLEKINWKNRLIGIKGARGTGKTTLVLQWLKERQLPSSQAVFFTLDDLYFTSHSLLETAKSFYKQGGKILVLDEVHKYPRWSQEIKNLYDLYRGMQIIFTGSSIIELSKQEGDLSRRVFWYELPGLSYREYLKFTGGLEIEPISLVDLINKSKEIQKLFPDDFRPLQYFKEYLTYGYYPFFAEDKEGYLQRVQQLIRAIVENDMAEIKEFDIRNAKKMLQLIYLIARQVPFKPNMIELSGKCNIHRNSLPNYFYFLEKARLLLLLYPSGISISTLQKPEKIFLDNCNLLYAIAPDNLSTGTLRETFFYNQISVKHKINYPMSGDFEIDDKYIFEVGGKNKTKKQIAGISNAYVVKDDIEYPTTQAIPLWLFGFLY